MSYAIVNKPENDGKIGIQNLLPAIDATYHIMAESNGLAFTGSVAITGN